MRNRSAIFLLFAANTVSGLAQGITLIAIPWYFTQIEKTPLFGTIYWVATVIALFWLPTAGTFVDKYNRKTLFLVLDIICGTIIGSIALSGFINGEVHHLLAALVFALTFFNFNLHYPALYSFLQEISEPKHYGFITSAVEVQGQLATVLAGAGGALLLEGVPEGVVHFLGYTWQLPFVIEPWPLHKIFALDAFTYFLAFILILLIRYVPYAVREPEEGSVWSRLKTGYRYLTEHPYIFLFGVASFSIFVTVLINGFYLVAIYVDNWLVRGGDVYAISEIFYAFGAIFAGFAIRRVFRGVSAVMSIILMTALTGGWYVVFILTKSVWLFYAMMFLIGVTNAGTRIQRITYLFQRIPNQVYGRANGILGLTNILWRIFFLSIFAAPFFHENGQVLYAFGLMSFFLIIATLVMAWFYRRIIEAT